MPNFKFIKQFSTQVSTGGFNNKILTKTIPKDTVLSGNYVDNKTTGSKEVSIILSYIPIQGATTNVNVPLNLVVETTEPVSKSFYNGFSDEAKNLLFDKYPNTTKKYVFLKNYIGVSESPDCAKANPPCSFMPSRRFFKEGEIVEGILKNINGDTYVKIGVHGVLYASPTANIIPILKELNPEPNSTTNKNKEKPIKTERATIFNEKNIVIGILVLGSIGATLAILKWKKII